MAAEKRKRMEERDLERQACLARKEAEKAAEERYVCMSAGCGIKWRGGEHWLDCEYVPEGTCSYCLCPKHAKSAVMEKHLRACRRAQKAVADALMAAHPVNPTPREKDTTKHPDPQQPSVRKQRRTRRKN
mmetsp:Transcript_15972/g.40967  ORF Transcript_15972/g.40967 Transcript_15972/m.40967 type:complete len:130 (-) Transcript_15972:37-426(-)